MENMIQEKIDRVLDGIQDPQTGMAISQMGLVEKIRYVEKSGKLIVFFKRLGHCKACCAALNLVMLSDFENAIKEGLKAEFPQFSVAFTNFPNT